MIDCDSQELCALEERSSNVSKQMLASSEQLAEIQDAVNEMTMQLEAKTGEGGDGHGSGAAVKLRRAIKCVKEEVREMSLRTAMLQAEILALRKIDVLSQRKKDIQKRKGRNRGSKIGKTSTPLEYDRSV